MNKHNRISNRLIVAGGGTGGHVLAGVAIADCWKKAVSADAIFIGAVGGIEEKLVPRSGYQLHLLSLGSLKGVGLGKQFKTLLKIPFALLISFSLLIRYRPTAVIGVGGYASGPFVLAARLIGWLWQTRVAILEQNAVPGFTNRLLARFVDKIFSAFPGLEKSLPGNKVILTGNPVRAEMKRLGPSSRKPFTVFIFGGSQGAVGINTLVLEALPLLKDYHHLLKFIHQTGEKDYQRVFEGYEENKIEARVEKFIYEMAQAYEEASIVICRAGSSTLAEIAAVGRASVLIPFPQAADNHQEKNAQIFQDKKAARMLRQSEATGKTVADLLVELLKDPEKIEEMERNVSFFHKPNAARDIVEALLYSHI